MRHSIRISLLALAFAAPVSAQTAVEYPLPEDGFGPTDVVAGPDGNVWFTESDANQIGRITPAGVITEFPLSDGSVPAGIALGPDGNLWFCENGANAIGRITPAGVVTEFPLPDAFPAGGPSDIAAGPDGGLWFTETDGGSAGRVRRMSLTGAVTASASPNPSQAPHQIVAGPDSNLWFSMPLSGRVGRVTTSGALTEFPLPSPSADALALAPGPDGAVWVAEHLDAGDRLARFASDGTATEVPIPGVTSSLYGLAAGPDGAFWFTETDASRIGRVTTAGAVSEFPLPTGSSFPWGIAVGPDGGLWFAEYDADQIGRLAVAPFPCGADATTLCLGGGRYRLTATFNSDRAAGAAHVVGLTSDSGYLWFFDPSNTEVVVKVLDGCAVNSHHWVFAAGLTNVGVGLTVADTQTGVVRAYGNARGTAFAPIQDAGAFPCP